MNEVFARAGLRVFERGWLSSNNVLFPGGSTQEPVLVDTGYVTHAAQTVALVRAALEDRPLARVVNTHLHSDHCGGNAALQGEFDCAIDVPSGEVDKVDRWDEAALTYRDTGQTCPRFSRMGAIRDGDEIRLGPYPWRVIAAPGHDPASVVLYQPDMKLLISADALWQNGFGVVFPEIEGITAFETVRQTLDRLAGLDVDWVIPGHGSPFQGMAAALGRAHQRLNGFLSDPARHSRHAAKVLIKFHMLEVREAERDQLIQWMLETRFMRLTHERHFAEMPFVEWSSALISELAASSAIRINGNHIHDD
jgi:glyoxylase-like metal-dependent hydrolase (beta-lactamase superfamily II)